MSQLSGHLTLLGSDMSSRGILPCVCLARLTRAESFLVTSHHCEQERCSHSTHSRSAINNLSFGEWPQEAPQAISVSLVLQQLIFQKVGSPQRLMAACMHGHVALHLRAGSRRLLQVCRHSGSPGAAQQHSMTMAGPWIFTSHSGCPPSPAQLSFGVQQLTLPSANSLILQVGKLRHDLAKPLHTKGRRVGR